jgi:hypothetical protein
LQPSKGGAEKPCKGNIRMTQTTISRKKQILSGVDPFMVQHIMKQQINYYLTFKNWHAMIG